MITQTRASKYTRVPTRPKSRLGDSPAVAMPNGQPTPVASAISEAQAAAGYYLQQSGITSPVTPAWSSSDVDGVYGARTLAVLKSIQAQVNAPIGGVPQTVIDTSDGSLTTSATNESVQPFDTLNWLRSYVTSSIAPAAMPYTFWGTAIQPAGTPVAVWTSPPAPNLPPVPSPTPTPAPASTPPTTTGMSTGEKVAIAAGAAVVVVGGGYAIYRMQKPPAPAASSSRRALHPRHA